MNILILAEDFFPITSGGAFEDKQVASKAVEEGHEVCVVTSRSSDMKPREYHQGVEIRRPLQAPFVEHEINSPLNFFGRLFVSVLILFYCLFLLMGRRFDIVYSTNHVFHFCGWVLTKLFSTSLVSYVAYTPSLNPENKFIANPLYILEQINFRFFMGKIVFCRNPQIQKRITSYNPHSSVRMSHGIVNASSIDSAIAEVEQNPTSPREWLSNQIDIKSESKLIAFAGRLVEIKRPVRAVDVIADLSIDYELIFVGSGDQRQEIESAIKNHRVEDRVHFLGMVPHNDAIRTMLASDYLLLTSKVESYPTVVFEALACSCAVVAPPVGILPHLSISNDRLRLEDKTKLAEAFEGLSTGECSVNSDILEEYSIGSFAKDILQSFEELNDDHTS